jgi:hypothetical protein
LGIDLTPNVDDGYVPLHNEDDEEEEEEVFIEKYLQVEVYLSLALLFK